ncbi:MAG: hypothetical protein U9Q37_09235 [Euryarchaeota archaeon]|nr:hypothetical protein [Euryarchaeota archaeon]
MMPVVRVGRLRHPEKILLEGITRKLSLAVYLVDEYSNKGIADDLGVSLKDQNMDPVRTIGGYYIFFDLPDSSYTVQVRGGTHYFDEAMAEVQLADLDTRNPVVSITLKPTPSYRFPPSSTLIRGSLWDPYGRGMPEAEIQVKERDIRTKTNGNGEFVIYFRDSGNYDVTTIDEKKLVIINGENPILEIAHRDYRKKIESVVVEEGKITSLSITYP